MGAGEVWSILVVSLKVSLIATLLASATSLPLALTLAFKEFPGRQLVILGVHSLMALPTVVVGLLLYGVLSRSGPLGFLGLLYTPTAMIAGQFVLALPIVTALTHAAIRGVDPRVVRTAKTLGANRWQAARIVLGEARYGLVAAIAAGLGRVITEVGSAILIGGNIRGYTRTMTTAIALETSRGRFSLGLILGSILLITAVGLNLLIARLVRRP